MPLLPSRAPWYIAPACNNVGRKDRKTSGAGGGLDVRWIWPWQDRNRRFSWLKACAFALMLLPGARACYQIAVGDYGSYSLAIPSLTYWSGVWATWFLLLALAVTPAMVVFRWRGLIAVRRMVGVTALFYTIGHILIYFALRQWNFELIWGDMLTRLTLIVATVSTIGLIVLGLTSFDAAIRSMGAEGWQRLHNWTYLISGLALLHVVLARGTYTEQYMLTGAFVWLMAWRVLDRYALGANVKALALLTVTASIFTALLEAGYLYGRRGFAPMETLALNFNVDGLDFGIPPAWQVLGLGLVFVLGAAARQALLLKAARLEARRA